MIIETTSSYKVGDKIFATFQEAQLDALTTLFTGAPTDGTPASIADCIIGRKDEVLAILSMSEPVKRGRKPRSDQGGKHAKKKAKAPETAPIESTVTGSGKYAGQ